MINSNRREHVKLCRVRLGEVTHESTTGLTEFAEWRLVASGLSASGAEDLVQRAYWAVLAGAESDQAGRQPRLADLETKAEFQNYLRGIISSLVFAQTRKREFSAIHTELDDSLTKAEEMSAYKNAEMTDLRNQLFPRLRARVQKKHLPTVDAWESVFMESDRVPAPGQRSYVRDVKTIAQQILRELGGF